MMAESMQPNFHSDLFGSNKTNIGFAEVTTGVKPHLDHRRLHCGSSLRCHQNRGRFATWEEGIVEKVERHASTTVGGSQIRALSQAERSKRRTWLVAAGEQVD